MGFLTSKSRHISNGLFTFLSGALKKVNNPVQNSALSLKPQEPDFTPIVYFFERGAPFQKNKQQI